jgi:curved DNA-binding protein CbpA
MQMNSKLLEVLLELHGKKRSGILRIQKDREKRQLLLNDGLLVLAESNLPQEHLAWVMVNLNLLPRDKLDAVSSSMKGGKTSEEALLNLPEARLEDVKSGRRNQALKIISSMLVWDDCEFRFYPGENLIRYEANLEMQLPELIIVSVRQAIETHHLKAPAHFVDHTFEIAAKPVMNSFPLNQAEHYVYSMLRTPVKAGELIPGISAVVPKPDQVLLCLYLLGFISFHTDPIPGVVTEAPGGMDADPLVRRMEEMLVHLDSANLYEILSVKTDASQEDIQAAYHEQARQLHPDRFQTKGFSAEIRGKAEQVFARINQAYMTLKNPASRILYDEQWAKQKVGAGPKPGTAQSAETAEALFREGKSLLAKGDLKTAVERLKGAVWLYPEKAVYNYYLGIAEARNPKLRKSAEQHLLKAIELEDVSHDSHLALAKLYIEVHLPRKAESHLQRVLAWDRTNAEARNLLAALKKP